MEAIIRTGNIENEKWNCNRVETVKHKEENRRRTTFNTQKEINNRQRELEFYSITYVNKLLLFEIFIFYEEE